MSLSEQDVNYIREIAVNAASQVSKQIIEDILKWHTEACPHGKAILASKWGIVGWIVGSGCLGATFGPKLFALISKLIS